MLGFGPWEIGLVLVGWKDARWGQIVSLGAFNIIGLTIVDFRITGVQILSAVGIACVTEIVLIARQDRVIAFPASGLISGLGLAFLLRSDSPYLLHGLCGFLSIASKYAIRIEGKHIYNPTNFGIVLLLLLFPDNAWITGGAWGTYFVFVIEAVNIALFVGYRVGRFHVAIAWYGTLGLLLLMQAAFTELPVYTVRDRMQNGVLIIFTFFMITDPKTSPNTWSGRVVYAAATAVVAFILMVAEVRFAAFFALFFITSLVPFVDRFMSGSLFMWETEHELSLATATAPPRVEVPRRLPIPRRFTGGKSD